MKRSVPRGAPLRADYIVFTDLDGTLLDHHTYSWREASSALARLRSMRIPVILCSSKTAVEMRPLVKELRLRAPYIVENGGGIRIPEKYFPVAPEGSRRVRDGHAIDLGIRYPKIIEKMKRWRRFQFRGFHEMSAREVAAECGLPLMDAKRAKEREYDEPFLLMEEDPGRRREFLGLVRKSGLRCTRGGRFHHITGTADKGGAVRRLQKVYRLYSTCVFSIGLGDSPNDLSMLRATDLAVIIPRPDGKPDPMLRARLRDKRTAPHPGPRGWNDAVHLWLDSLRAP